VEFLNKIRDEVTNHPREENLEAFKDVIFGSLMKYFGLIPSSSKPEQVGSVGDNMELEIVPYIITEDISSHQSLNGYLIIEFLLEHNPNFLGVSLVLGT